jgi:tetratricopeptide (TPR) repeat protein
MAEADPWLFGEADAQYERAAHLLREGKIDAALREATEAKELAPRSPRILRLYARVLVLAGKPDQANAVLEQLGAVDPATEDLDYALALESYRAQDWEQARQRLEDLPPDSADPGLVQLYLGASYQELGDLTSSEQALDRALALDAELAGPVAYRRGVLALQRANYPEAQRQLEIVVDEMPDSPVANSAREYLAQLERRTPRRWEVFIRAGMGYDSNINLANSNEAFVSSGEQGWRAVTTAGGSYQFGDDELGLQIGQTLYGHFYTQERQYDQQASLTWAWANFALRENVQVDFRYGFEFAWADWSQYRSSNNIEPGLTWEITPTLATRVSYRREDRSYFFTPATPEFNRDGDVQYAGIDLFYSLPSIDQVAQSWMRVGYRYRKEATKGNQFRSRGDQPLLTLAVNLPWQLQSIVDARVEWRDYDAASLYQPTAGPRRDRIAIVRAGLERPLGRQTSLEVSYRYTNRDSNVNFFVYDRHEINFMATYRY